MGYLSRNGGGRKASGMFLVFNSPMWGSTPGKQTSLPIVSGTFLKKSAASQLSGILQVS